MLPTIALKILAELGGTKFDPVLVKAFINTIGVYPIGSLLKLVGGSLAVVADVSKLPDKVSYPTLKIVANEKGQKIENGKVINLAETPDAVQIENAVHPDDYVINVAHYLFGDAAKAT